MGVSESIMLRAYEDSADRGFVLATWVRSYQAVEAKGRSARTRYLEYFPRIVERLIAAPSTVCVVACSRDKPTTIHGWACGDERGFIHWAYVPPELRRNGIARACIERIAPKRATKVLVSHSLPFRSAAVECEPYLLAM